MKASDGLDTERDDIWKLRKSLYRLKQVLYVWNKLLDSTLKRLGFSQCRKDSGVYSYRLENTFVILAVHVDNMVIVSNSNSGLSKMKLDLSRHFKVKDLGEVKFLLGIEVIRNRKSGMIELLQQAYIIQLLKCFNLQDEALQQLVYINQLLKCFNLQDVKASATPLSTGTQLTQNDCPTTKEEINDMANIPYASLIRAVAKGKRKVIDEVKH